MKKLFARNRLLLLSLALAGSLARAADTCDWEEVQAVGRALREKREAAELEARGISRMPYSLKKLNEAGKRVEKLATPVPEPKPSLANLPKMPPSAPGDGVYRGAHANGARLGYFEGDFSEHLDGGMKPLWASLMKNDLEEIYVRVRPGEGYAERLARAREYAKREPRLRVLDEAAFSGGSGSPLEQIASRNGAHSMSALIGERDVLKESFHAAQAPNVRYVLAVSSRDADMLDGVLAAKLGGRKQLVERIQFDEAKGATLGKFAEVTTAPYQVEIKLAKADERMGAALRKLDTEVLSKPLVYDTQFDIVAITKLPEGDLFHVQPSERAAEIRRLEGANHVPQRIDYREAKGFYDFLRLKPSSNPYVGEYWGTVLSAEAFQHRLNAWNQLADRENPLRKVELRYIGGKDPPMQMGMARNLRDHDATHVADPRDVFTEKYAPINAPPPTHEQLTAVRIDEASGRVHVEGGLSRHDALEVLNSRYLPAEVLGRFKETSIAYLDLLDAVGEGGARVKGPDVKRFEEVFANFARTDGAAAHVANGDGIPLRRYLQWRLHDSQAAYHTVNHLGGWLIKHPEGIDPNRVPEFFWGNVFQREIQMHLARGGVRAEGANPPFGAPMVVLNFDQAREVRRGDASGNLTLKSLMVHALNEDQNRLYEAYRRVHEAATAAGDTALVKKLDELHARNPAVFGREALSDAEIDRIVGKFKAKYEAIASYRYDGPDPLAPTPAKVGELGRDALAKLKAPANDFGALRALHEGVPATLERLASNPALSEARRAQISKALTLLDLPGAEVESFAPRFRSDLYRLAYTARREAQGSAGVAAQADELIRDFERVATTADGRPLRLGDDARLRAAIESAIRETEKTPVELFSPEASRLARAREAVFVRAFEKALGESGRAEHAPLGPILARICQAGANCGSVSERVAASAGSTFTSAAPVAHAAPSSSPLVAVAGDASKFRVLPEAERLPVSAQLEVTRLHSLGEGKGNLLNLEVRPPKFEAASLERAEGKFIPQGTEITESRRPFFDYFGFAEAHHPDQGYYLAYSPDAEGWSTLVRRWNEKAGEDPVLKMYVDFADHGATTQWPMARDWANLQGRLGADALELYGPNLVAMGSPRRMFSDTNIFLGNGTYGPEVLRSLKRGDSGQVLESRGLFWHDVQQGMNSLFVSRELHEAGAKRAHALSEILHEIRASTRDVYLKDERTLALARDFKETSERPGVSSEAKNAYKGMHVDKGVEIGRLLGVDVAFFDASAEHGITHILGWLIDHPEGIDPRALERAVASVREGKGLPADAPAAVRSIASLGEQVFGEESLWQLARAGGKSSENAVPPGHHSSPVMKSTWTDAKPGVVTLHSALEHWFNHGYDKVKAFVEDVRKTGDQAAFAAVRRKVEELEAAGLLRRYPSTEIDSMAKALRERASAVEDFARKLNPAPLTLRAASALSDEELKGVSGPGTAYEAFRRLFPHSQTLLGEVRNEAEKALSTGRIGIAEHAALVASLDGAAARLGGEANAEGQRAYYEAVRTARAELTKLDRANEMPSRARKLADDIERGFRTADGRPLFVSGDPAAMKALERAVTEVESLERWNKLPLFAQAKDGFARETLERAWKEKRETFVRAFRAALPPDSRLHGFADRFAETCLAGALCGGSRAEGYWKKLVAAAPVRSPAERAHVYSAEGLKALEKKKPALAAAIRLRDATARDLAEVRRRYLAKEISAAEMEKAQRQLGRVEAPVRGASEPARRAGYLAQEQDYLSRELLRAKAEGNQKQAEKLANQRAAISAQWLGELRKREMGLTDPVSAREARRDAVASISGLLDRYDDKFGGRKLAQVASDPAEAELLRTLAARDLTASKAALEQARADLRDTVAARLVPASPERARLLADDLVAMHAASGDPTKLPAERWTPALRKKCEEEGLCSPKLEARKAAPGEPSRAAREAEAKKQLAKAPTDDEAHRVAALPPEKETAPKDPEARAAAVAKETKAARAETAELAKESRAPAAEAAIGERARKQLAEVQALSEEQRAELSAALEKLAKEKPGSADAALKHAVALGSNPDLLDTYRLSLVHAVEELKPGGDWEKAWEAGVRRMLDDSGYGAAEIEKVVDEKSGLRFYQQTARCLKI